MKTNIEKVADSCAHFAGEAREIADSRISEAMEQSHKNMIATPGSGRTMRRKGFTLIEMLYK